MKKLFILAVAAMAMTACSNQEEVFINDGVKTEIGFGVVNHALSRNIAADGATFSVNNTMHVTGFYHPESGAAYNYFTDQLFSHKGQNADNKEYWASGSTGAWSPIFYPVNGTIDFMAYSSTTDANAANKWDTTAKTVVLDYSGLNGLDDVMYSDILAGVPCAKDTKVQTLNFRHALAWIYVNVKAGEATITPDNLKIKEVRVNDVYLGGTATVSFKEKDATGKGSTVEWSNPTAKNTDGYELINRGELTSPYYPITATETPWGNGILLPKQAMTSITLVYSVYNLGAWTDDITYTLDLSTAGTWTDGLKYTYNFTITLNEITVNGSVTGFDEGANEDIIL